MKLLKKILENKEKFEDSIEKRGLDKKVLDIVFKLAKDRSSIIQKFEKLKLQKNNLNKEITKRIENKKEVFIQKLKLQKIKELINNEIILKKEIENKIQQKILEIPNLLHKSVPFGKNENENVVIDVINEHLINKNWRGLPHYEMAKKFNLFSQEKGTRISGSRFLVYEEKLAKLIRALTNFCLDFNSSRGYKETNVPSIVSEKMLIGTGQLPKFKKDLFKIKNEDLWLIPTAEVPLTTLNHNQIINLEKPLCYTGFTKCFRSEAGSGGRDIRGMIRLREFHKVEIVKITKIEDAYFEFEKMIEDVTKLLKMLELPFRKVLLCSGDIGFSSEKTIDFEVWFPSENKYREISSVSIFNDFQAMRSKIRYRNKNNEELKIPFTMNGSAIAIDRCIAAILENCQDENNNVLIPKKLISYYKAKIL